MTLSFGDYEIDVERRELRRAKAPGSQRRYRRRACGHTSASAHQYRLQRPALSRHFDHRRGRRRRLSRFKKDRRRCISSPRLRAHKRISSSIPAPTTCAILVDVVDYPDSKKIAVAAGVKNADFKTATYVGLGRL